MKTAQLDLRLGTDSSFVLYCLMMFLLMGPLSAQTDLSGEWCFRFTVTEANGICSDEVGEVGTDIVTLNHDMTAGTVSIVWTEEFIENTAQGTVIGDQLSYSIIFRQEGGWTNRNVVATIKNENEMTGAEAWSYGYSIDDQTACSDAAANFEARRIPQGGDQVLIPSLRSFGSELAFLMGATAEGRRLIELYNRHRVEILCIYLTNPQIGGSAIASVSPGTQESGALLETYDSVKETLGAVLANDGPGPVINQAMVTQISNLANMIKAEASEELASDIQEESDRLNGFQDLVGLGVEEVAQVMGIDLESLKFRIYDSSLKEGRFRTEVGFVEGLVFELWKSKTLVAGSWSKVEHAELVVEDDRVILTDPSPEAESCLYRVMRIQPN